jgi:hypothetical protein
MDIEWRRREGSSGEVCDDIRAEQLIRTPALISLSASVLAAGVRVDGAAWQRTRDDLLPENADVCQ